MSEPQMGNVVSAEDLSRPNVETPSVPEEKICCTRCAAEIPEVDAVCSVCGFAWNEARKQKITRYSYYFLIGFLLLFLNPFLNYLVPEDTFLFNMLNFLFSFSFIAGFVFAVMFLYQCWSMIPKKNRSAWPGQYVGFLFVPIYQFYWIFPAFYGLAKRQNQLLPEEKQNRIRPAILLILLTLVYGFQLFILVTFCDFALSISVQDSPFFINSAVIFLNVFVTFVVAMLFFSMAAVILLKSGACSLLELPPEEKKRIMMFVPGAPGAKKLSLWPIPAAIGFGILFFFLSEIIFPLILSGCGGKKPENRLLQVFRSGDQLQKIAISLKSYANDNEGQFPAQSGKEGLAFLLGGKSSSSASGDSSCIYLGGLNNRMSPDTIVAFFAHPPSHGDSGIYTVLCVNGDIQPVILSGKDGYIELFRKSGFLDDSNAFTEKGKQLLPETRDYILRLVKEQSK